MIGCVAIFTVSMLDVECFSFSAFMLVNLTYEDFEEDYKE